MIPAHVKPDKTHTCVCGCIGRPRGRGRHQQLQVRRRRLRHLDVGIEHRSRVQRRTRHVQARNLGVLARTRGSLGGSRGGKPLRNQLGVERALHLGDDLVHVGLEEDGGGVDGVEELEAVFVGE
eukprot:2741981-Pleurochrysis_carterae.AAC.1